MEPQNHSLWQGRRTPTHIEDSGCNFKCAGVFYYLEVVPQTSPNSYNYQSKKRFGCRGTNLADAILHFKNLTCSMSWFSWLMLPLHKQPVQFWLHFVHFASKHINELGQYLKWGGRCCHCRERQPNEIAQISQKEMQMIQQLHRLFFAKFRLCTVTVWSKKLETWDHACVP